MRVVLVGAARDRIRLRQALAMSQIEIAVTERHHFESGLLTEMVNNGATQLPGGSSDERLHLTRPRPARTG